MIIYIYIQQNNKYTGIVTQLPLSKYEGVFIIFNTRRQFPYESWINSLHMWFPVMSAHHSRRNATATLPPGRRSAHPREDSSHSRTEQQTRLGLVFLLRLGGGG